MKIRKFNYYRFFMFILILGLIIFGVVKYINDKNYKESYEYKLLEVGYINDEINVILDKLNKNQIDKLLTIKYDKNIVLFIKEKYFLFKNLEDYLSYKKSHLKTENSYIVSVINTEANIDWFDNERITDISKNELVLVNRIYGLPEDYVPEDIVLIPLQYAYDGKRIRNSILDEIESLIDDGRNNGYSFIVSSGYRSNKEQESLYKNYSNSYGMSEADKYVAHPGHSEYETGYTFDLSLFSGDVSDLNSSEEYTWLKNNAHKYGFIFRHEKGKEELTGFPYSSFRLRYVGKDAATLIYNEKICFEEYYAYFVKGDTNE